MSHFLREWAGACALFIWLEYFLPAGPWDQGTVISIQLPLLVEEAEVSVLPGQMDTFLIVQGGWYYVRDSEQKEGQMRAWEPHSACTHQEAFRKNGPGIHKTSWQTTLQKMKTSKHNLNCLKQTIQPLVTLDSIVQPWGTCALANKGGRYMLWSPSCLCSW